MTITTAMATMMLMDAVYRIREIGDASLLDEVIATNSQLCRRGANLRPGHGGEWLHPELYQREFGPVGIAARLIDAFHIFRRLL